MIRPMTSDVAALSGFVANGHQVIHFVSSAPSKIPYGGFSPVRLQTGCQPRPSLLPQLIRGHSGDLVRARLSRNRTCVRRHSRLLTPPTRPVALGSASGYSVRQPHRLLWPHPSFCRPRRVYVLMPAVARPAEGPHFYPQSLMTCRRPYSDGSSDPPTNQITDLAFTSLIKVRQPFGSTHRTTGGDFTKLQRSHTAAARHLACPAPGGTFTTELACPGSLHRQVGHHYRNVRFIPGRTRTGCSVSFVGCTSRLIKATKGCRKRGEIARLPSRPPPWQMTCVMQVTGAVGFRS